MKHPVLLALPIAAALVLGACGKSEEPAEDAAAPASGAVDEPKTDVEKALADVQEKGREAIQAAAEAADKMAESAREKGGEIAEATMEQSAEFADAANAKAEELAARVKEYIENNDTDLAAETMEKLREIKASLSESARAQIEQLEEALAAAKGEAEPHQGQ